MAVKSTIYGGTDITNGVVLPAVDWNDTFDITLFRQNPIVILGFTFASVIQGTWVRAIDTNRTLQTHVNNNTDTAVNDEITWKLWLPEGTYTAVVYFTGGPQNGIMHFEIDTADKATFDTYTGGTTHASIGSSSSINNTSSGLKDFDIKMATKNGSSSNYRLELDLVVLIRTGDST